MSKESALNVVILGGAGHSGFAKLEERLGPCADGTGEMLVWAGAGTEGLAETRSFTISAELAATVAGGGYLAPGVAFSVSDNKPYDYELRGPGARTTAAMQGVPGMRQRPFPRLPSAWENAIRKAVAR